MTTTQVISISPKGEVSGLQVKPGKGFDLRKLGKAKIERASEVLFNEDNQKWYVQIVKGKYAGDTVTYMRHQRALGEPVMTNCDFTLHFNEYDEAVQAEIAVLDHIRLTEGPSAL